MSESVPAVSMKDLEIGEIEFTWAGVTSAKAFMFWSSLMRVPSEGSARSSQKKSC